MSISEDLLQADFDQCFNQMRHYEEGFKKTTEYAFAGIAAVATAYTALIGRYGWTATVLGGMTILLSIAALVGVMAVMWLAKNRIYYAFVARYVNEVRRAYLASSPAGVTNVAGIYTDPTVPRIFNPYSAHAAYIYVVAILSSGVISALVETGRALWATRAGVPLAIHWCVDIGVFIFAFLVQVAAVLLYWNSKDKNKNRSRKVAQPVTGGNK